MFATGVAPGKSPPSPGDGYPPTMTTASAPSYSYSTQPPGYDACTPTAGTTSPQYTPQQPAQIVMIQPLVGGQLYVGDRPVNCICPSCRAQVISRCVYEPGVFAWVICISLFVLGCWVCCVIPLFIPECKDVIHECPNCNAVIGVHKKL